MPRTQAALRRWSEPKSSRPPAEVARLLAIAHRGLNIVRHVTGIEGTCLSRSLALWAVLRRRGVETDLTVGFRKKEGRMEGHAWLEHEGIPVNESPAEVATYTISAETKAFDRLPESGSADQITWR